MPYKPDAHFYIFRHEPERRPDLRRCGRASFTFELKPDNTGLTPPSGVTSVLGRSSLAIALHEAGHTLGLGDLYMGENAKNSGIYSLAQFYDPISISSVMNRSEDLTCADADGLPDLRRCGRAD